MSMNFFGSRLYLVLSTLSRSTSFEGGGEEGSWGSGREEDERLEGGRGEGGGLKNHTSGSQPASPLHDREHLAAPLSGPALLHGRVLALKPQRRQLTNQPDHVFHPNRPAVAVGGSQTFRVKEKRLITFDVDQSPRKSRNNMFPEISGTCSLRRPLFLDVLDADVWRTRP